MDWDEFKKMAQILIKFNKLHPDDKERVLLMMDGLKLRAAKEEQHRKGWDELHIDVKDLLS